MASQALAGRVALVTGAASGMGRVMAKSLAEAGAGIAAFDMNRDTLDRLAADFALAGHDILTILGDVSVAADCKRAVQAATDRFGGVDILINCAGISLGPISPPGHEGPLRLWEITPEGWHKIHAINNIGAFYMARFVVEAMMRKGWGRIINITTSYDTMLAGGFSPYGSSKSALEAASAAWAKDLAGTGVTVNILVPGGPTDTPFLTPRTRARGNLLQPDIMGPPVAWLASPASDGQTGFRFLARDWDTQMDPAEAAERCRAPAAWPDAAAQATKARGRSSTGD